MTQGSDYRSIKAISNSLMGVYEDEYGTFLSYWVYNKPLPGKSTSSLTIGSLIDTLLTRPEDYEKMFCSFDGLVPTGQMDLFCRELAKHPDYSYEDAYKAVGFKRDKLENIVEKFQLYKDYLGFLVASNLLGLNVVDKEDDAKAKRIVAELKLGKYTSDVVNMDNSVPGIDVYYQLELFNRINPFELQYPDIGIDVKGALDKVIVDHNREIIYPIDYKSSFNTDQFDESYVKYRYYRQGSFYTHLLKLWAVEQGFANYRIAAFAFVVCSTGGGKHYIYKMDSNDLIKAEWGGELLDGTQIKGWRNILFEIAYLDKLGSWEYPYKAVHNNGVVPLQIFKIDKDE